MADRGFLNHIWYKLLDEEGRPIPNATVFFYDKNLVPLITYTSNDMTTSASSASTNSQGVFEFYVQDDIGVPPSADGHYAWDTEYIISWNDGLGQSGIIEGDALFGRYAQVDETDSSNTRVNKAMSNYLGWFIQDHIDFMFGTTQNCGSSSSSSSSVSSSSISLSSSSSSSESSSSESSSSQSSSSTSLSSASLPSGGLFDATWIIGPNVMDDSPLLVDGDLLTAAETGAKIEEDVAYGISFTGTVRCQGLDVYCITSGTSVEQDQLVKPRTGFRFQAQYSDDNNTWINITQYGSDAFPSTVWYQRIPILDKGAGTFVFRLPFAQEVPSGSHFNIIDILSETLSVSAAGGSIYPLQIAEIRPMDGRCTEDGWTTSLQYFGSDMIVSDYAVAGDNRVWENQTNGAVLYVHNSKFINPYGKYYWEVIPSGGTTTTLCGFTTQGSNNRIGFTSRSWGFFMQSGTWYYINSSSWTTMGTAYSSGQVLQFAVDQFERKAWLGINGTWFNSGDPENGTNPLWTNIDKGLLVAGSSTFSIGHKYISYFKESQMNYSIPTGFQAPVA